MHATVRPASQQPFASGDPDPCGLAPAALAPIDPLATSPVRRGRGTVVRVRGGMVRRGQVMRHLASEVGQGTVEYVGLLLLMATMLAAVVGVAGGLGGDKEIGAKVVKQIGESIDRVDNKAKKP